MLLGIVQGLTEFLPISSSAHLILGRTFFGWDAGRPRPGVRTTWRATWARWPPSSRSSGATWPGWPGPSSAPFAAGRAGRAAAPRRRRRLGARGGWWACCGPMSSRRAPPDAGRGGRDAGARGGRVVRGRNGSVPGVATSARSRPPKPWPGRRAGSRARAGRVPLGRDEITLGMLLGLRREAAAPFLVRPGRARASWPQRGKEGLELAGLGLDAQTGATLRGRAHGDVRRRRLPDNQVLHPLPRPSPARRVRVGTGSSWRAPWSPGSWRRDADADGARPLQWLRKRFVTGFFVTVPLAVSVAAPGVESSGVRRPGGAACSKPVDRGLHVPGPRRSSATALLVLLVGGTLANQCPLKQALQARRGLPCSRCRCSRPSTRRSSS